MSIFIIAEIGINHNGDLEIAKKLIDGAVFSGCNAVKFQKRTIEDVYSKEELDKPRESPWGTTNREQKNGLEFKEKEYDEINKYCKERNIEWLISSWDLKSQIFTQKYNLKYNKIASAMLTDKDFLTLVAKEGRHTFISTGMSTLEEINAAINIFKNNTCSFELMHCNSSYPMLPEQANLSLIPYFKEKHGCNVGYSGHEAGLAVSVAAAALGISSLERHITLDRSMYGSDQSASVEITEMHRLVDYVRTVETAIGQPIKKLYPNEEESMKKLRKVNNTLVTSS
ncbi:N-acetylneuraminate synthase [bacterium]|jgi:N-acetylneuraminate synthase|nr:N-acetylneuraminate synthase [bacterium]